MQGHSRWLPRLQQLQTQGFVELRKCGLVKSAQAIQNLWSCCVEAYLVEGIKKPEISLYSNCNFMCVWCRNVYSPYDPFLVATTLGAQVQAAGGLAAMTMAGQGQPAVSLSNLSDPRLQVYPRFFFSKNGIHSTFYQHCKTQLCLQESLNSPQTSLPEQKQGFRIRRVGPRITDADLGVFFSVLTLNDFLYSFRT